MAGISCRLLPAAADTRQSICIAMASHLRVFGTCYSGRLDTKYGTSCTLTHARQQANAAPVADATLLEQQWQSIVTVGDDCWIPFRKLKATWTALAWS